MIRDGWYCCDHCGQKLFRVAKNALCKGIEVKCKKCRKIVKVNIEPVSLTNK